MSEIKVDNLTGKTSAGNITVTSEGGAATQSLQQGLAKAWCNNDQNGQTINDSFNISSISDSGVGKTDYSFVSAMVNSSHAPQSSGFDNAVYVDFATSLVATTGFRSQTNNVDLEGLFVSTHGDLA